MARGLGFSRSLRLQRHFLAEAWTLSNRPRLQCLWHDRPGEIADAHRGETGRIVGVAGNALDGALTEV